jgi:FKBP-type peptidyl-prolyl cis-trans isomerase 2
MVTGEGDISGGNAVESEAEKGLPGVAAQKKPSEADMRSVGEGVKDKPPEALGTVKPKRKARGTAGKTGRRRAVKKRVAEAEHPLPGDIKEGKPKPTQPKGNMKLIVGAIIVLVVLTGLAYIMTQDKGYKAKVTAPTTPTSENASTADKYDIVTVDYTGSFLNGTVFDTSIREVAEKNGVYNPIKSYEPLTFTLGYGGLIKGFEEAIAGMNIGEVKEVTLPPEKAYGYRSEELIQAVERVQSSPIVQNISLDKFIDSIGKEPYVGMEFTVPNRSGYEVTWPMTVLAVYNDTVTFRYHPDRNATINTIFGPAGVYATEEEILIELKAEVGDKVLTLVGPAVITDVNEENITIDFNHPLADQTLKFKIKLLGVTKQ